jgi:cytochrome c oxidase cbb3-type subunit III
MPLSVKRVVIAAVMLAAGAMGYVAAQTPQTPPGGGGRGAAPGQGTLPPPPRGGGMLGGAGPADKPVVDAAAADRGKAVWNVECVSCHGSQARGTDNGSNLIRSVVVLRDRYGNGLGPFLRKGHPLQSGKPATSVTDAQITDLAHFLRQRVNDAMRGSPLFRVQNVLTGDPKAGAEFFNGPGKCVTCHSATGDLAGIARRYEPVDLQQRMMFPGTGRGGGAARGRGAAAVSSRSAVTVTVTAPSQPAVTGVLVQMDDFIVTLREATGEYRTFRRTPGVKVEKNDPLAAHVALLDTITDKQMHDLVAYLETLK